MQMPYFVRPRNSGRTFELRVKHGRLPNAVYRNFDLQEDAQRAGRDAVAALDRGEIPSWFERSERRALVTIAQAIVAYRGIRAVPPSTQLLLDTLINDVGNRPFVDVKLHMGGGVDSGDEARKAVGAGHHPQAKGRTVRCVRLGGARSSDMPRRQSLDQLPHGYSGYDEYTRQALAEQGVDIPGDVERNRWIDSGEEGRIVDVLRQRLHRHSLGTVFSLLAHDGNIAIAFPAPMLQSTSGMHKRTSSGMNHGFTPMAVQISTIPARGRRLEA
jgi:hypothetical protein